MKKKDNLFMAALKSVVKFLLKVFYRNKTFRQKKNMREINFLAPKSESLNVHKKHRKSA